MQPALSLVRCGSCGARQTQPADDAACVVCGAKKTIAVTADQGDTARSRPRRVEQTPTERLLFSNTARELTSILPSLRQYYFDQRADRTSHPKSATRRLLVGVALVLLLVPAGLLATRSASRVALYQRAERDAHRLAQRIEARRAETGLYPDAETWQQWVGGADGDSLLDPWRRPYFYSVDSRAFWITTYGADGRPGGAGVDEDLTFVFRYPNPRTALPHSQPK